MNILINQNGITLVNNSSSTLSDVECSDVSEYSSSVLDSSRREIKRGEISHFSEKSSRRLKELLLNLKFENCFPLSITLTLPRNVMDLESRFKRYRQYLIRRGHWAIWRVELQRRGVPHFHMVGSCSDVYDAADYWIGWLDANSDFIGHPGFCVYGAVVNFCNASVGWYRYLALHSSKHKVSQLGYKGRQWGVINRSLVPFSAPVPFDVPADLCYKVFRICRWLTRYRSLEPIFFGSRIFFIDEKYKERIRKKYGFPF